MQSDEELCRQVAEHDAVAFEALLDRHQARAFRLACSILGSEADARDVSQDAFIRLYEAAGKFDGRSRFSTWFYRIVVNLCIDHKRRNKWWRKMVPFSNDDDPDAPVIDPPSPDPGPETLAILGDSGRRLRVALEGLSATQRAAVLLQSEEGLTSREIAQILKCSESTARVHIHRALAHLKKTMRKVE
ncbi:MAG: RNA polymerase sigma factor [Candidatus Binataceae bacterium]